MSIYNYEDIDLVMYSCELEFDRQKDLMNSLKTVLQDLDDTLKEVKKQIDIKEYSKGDPSVFSWNIDILCNEDYIK